MGKRILILAGSPFQMPLIERARRAGHYVITCDYLPSNPGHAIADEYHNVSTTDKEAVLRLARDLRVDAVTSMSTDPAVPVLAYVTDALGLPGPNADAVCALTEKDRFRALLSRIDLNAPEYFVVETDAVPSALEAAPGNYVVKPIDSSGSKGVTFCGSERARMTAAIRLALQHSRAGRCIIEEYIEGHQVHGDGYLTDGMLVHSYLGDHVFYTRTSSFIPVSTRWPCSLDGHVLAEISRQVEAICNAAGYRHGPVNIEARITPDDRVYIVEVGPRNGGNFVPIIQHALTGFDFVGRILADALDVPYSDGETNGSEKVGAYHVLHAERQGRYAGVSISDEARRHVFFSSIFRKEGEQVERFVGSNATVGVFLLRFDSVSQRDRVMDRAAQHFRLEMG